MDQNIKIAVLPEPKNFKIHHWTDEEKVFKRKEKILEDIKELHITFQTALLYKLSKSVFGPFLSELNSMQVQNKLLNDNKIQILSWEIKRYTEHDLNIINNRNIYFQDYYTLLKTAVNDCEVIDLQFLQSHLNHLSLNCCFMKQVDSCLLNFENIEALTLCGNYIKDIAGYYLPRKLKYLELFDNFVADVTSLVKRIPKTLLHLGLGRNRLTNDSHLHLLANRKHLTLLRSLDISDNDICDLKSVLINLKEISSVTTFSLEGNPCAVVPEYKNEVLMYFPNLQYLDRTEVLKGDNANINKAMSEEIFPQIIFRCHRILGLPEPPKDSKNTQVFYIEVNFPLLIENSTETESELVNETTQEEIKEHNEETASQGKEKGNLKGKDKDKKDKEKHKKEKSEKSEKEQTKSKKKSYYAAANEYDEKFEKSNVWYKTDRTRWSKIMEFPPISLNVPENNLTLIRDTFRSNIPVRLIYLKIAPFSSKPKKQKGKEKPKKDKNSKKTAQEEIDNPTPDLENAIEEQQSETILKKITLASFYCELTSVNWSDDTLDFYWADHDDIGNKALRINGSLKAIDYDVNLNPKKAQERIQKIKETGETGVIKKEPIPHVLTCQVGFGLNRY